MAKRNFGKDYKTPRELVTLLENRGLIINDRQKAQLYLESIGYYRFDKKLRLLLFNEIEKIEIAVREAVMNMTAERTGDIYWLTNSTHFRDQSIFNNSMVMLSKEYERSTEDFIEHFKKTYSEPFPPAWILGELLPMGSVNMYYRNLKDKGLKKQIAKRFYLHAPVFESWLSVLTLTRNACCHHAPCLEQSKQDYSK